MIKRKKKKLY